MMRFYMPAFRVLSNRIKAAGVEWLTFQQAPDCAAQTAQQTMTDDRFIGIRGAGWMKTASRRDQRRNPPLIETKHCQRYPH